MKLKIKQLFQLLLGIALIAGAAYCIWRVALFFIEKMQQVNSSVAAAIIGAMATVTAGILAVIITQKQTKIREIEEAHREKKVEIYNKFLTTIIRVLKGANENIKSEPISEEELIELLVEYKREILLWGSPKVIKAQLHYETVAGNTYLMFHAVDNLYRAIREDIGLSNKGLQPLDLFKLFLKDPQEIDAFLQSEQQPK